MLTCEMKVNGSLIAHLKIVSTGEVGRIGNHLYRYESYKVSTAYADPRITEGEVHHNRTRGAFSLIEKVLKDVRKQEADDD